MTTSGRVTGAWGLAVLAVLAAGPAAAADRARAPAEGAVRAAAPQAANRPAGLSAGGRSVAPEEVARIERRIEGRPATTIWQARLPDGTLELTDRPPAAGASAVQSRSYALPEDDEARRRAQAERAYWRKQAEGFEARRSERERIREQPVAPVTTVIVQAEVERPAVYHGYGWVPPVVGGGLRPVVPVAPFYATTPGAVQGRDGGFLGSGFGTRR